MNATKSWASRPRSIRFHQEDDKDLDRESFEQRIPVSVLIRSLVKEGLDRARRRNQSRKQDHGFRNSH